MELKTKRINQKQQQPSIMEDPGLNQYIDQRIYNFPKPPEYYKEFKSPDSFQPPNLNYLNKINCFQTFGHNYKLNDLNISFNPVEINCLKKLSKKKLENVTMYNNNFFEEISDKKISLNNVNCDSFNIVEELENEIKFLRERYKCLLNDICKGIDKYNFNCTLIKLSIQKINFYLIALRKKSAIKQTIDYFEKQIQDNNQVTRQISTNIQNCKDSIEAKLNELKNDV